jgi:hypothetical protein
MFYLTNRLVSANLTAQHHKKTTKNYYANEQKICSFQQSRKI